MVRRSQSRMLFWIYAQLFHSRKQCRSIEPKTRRRSIVTSDAPLAFSKRAYDLIALLLSVYIGHAFLTIKCIDRLFHNSRDLFVVLRPARQRRFISLGLP